MHVEASSGVLQLVAQGGETEPLTGKLGGETRTVVTHLENQDRRAHGGLDVQPDVNPRRVPMSEGVEHGFFEQQEGVMPPLRRKARLELGDGRGEVEGHGKDGTEARDQVLDALGKRAA